MTAYILHLFKSGRGQLQNSSLEDISSIALHSTYSVYWNNSYLLQTYEDNYCRIFDTHNKHFTSFIEMLTNKYFIFKQNNESGFYVWLESMNFLVYKFYWQEYSLLFYLILKVLTG